MWKKDIVVTFRIKLERQKYNDKIICLNNPLPNDVTDVLGPRHLGCILSFDAPFLWLQINSLDNYIPNKILNTQKG